MSGTKSRLAVLGLTLLLGYMRVYAATITLTTLDDSGPGSLRDALANIADGDTIDGSALTGTVSLTSSELLVSNSVTILGSGPSHFTITGNLLGPNQRAVHVLNDVTVTLAGLTITKTPPPTPSANSSSLIITNGGGILTNILFAGVSGAGILNDASTVIVSNCLIAGNSGGVGNGGGICNNATSNNASLYVIDSTFAGNTAYAGGALYNSSLSGGTATVVAINSTFSGNGAGSGSAIYSGGLSSGLIIGGIPTNHVAAAVTLLNCTFSGNGYYSSGILQIHPPPPGSIVNFLGLNLGRASLSLGGCILADTGIGNLAANNTTITSFGFNLSTDNGSDFLTAASDQTNTDPLLGPLQDNGGPTPTHLPLPCSPALDAGTNFTGTATDQRGGAFPRTFDNPNFPNLTGSDGTDIGAVEIQTTPTNTLPIVLAHPVTVGADERCSADASIYESATDPDDGDTVTLTQSPAGPYPIGQTLVTLTATDRCGETNSTTAIVTVLDLVPPTITCPGNLTLDANSPTGTVVNYATPTATDTCSEIATLIGSPPSGTSFGAGDTLVTLTAIDAAGNTNTCAFIVHVNGPREQLTATIDSLPALNLDPHLARQLSTRLEKILLTLNPPATSKSCRSLAKLVQFIARRHATGKLTFLQAEKLIARLHNLAATLGCP